MTSPLEPDDIAPPSPEAVAPAPPRLLRLRTRAQFLAAAKGASLARGAAAVQQRPRGDGDPAIGVGVTATKKVGGAVVRNRCKRRLREAARALLPLHGQPGCDYVFIARAGTAERDWPRLLDDVRSALTGLAMGATSLAPSAGRAAPPPVPARAPDIRDPLVKRLRWIKTIRATRRSSSCAWWRC